MTDIITTVINLSFNAVVTIGVVLVFRGMFSRIPKGFICVLWGIVAIKIICPLPSVRMVSDIPFQISITTSDNSLMQNTEVVKAGTSDSVYVDSQILRTDYNKPDYSEQRYYTYKHSEQKLRTVFIINKTTGIWLYILWISGEVILTVIYLAQYIKLKKIVSRAVPIRIIYSNRFTEFDNVYVSDEIKTPFVMGMMRPKVYMPSFLDEETYEYAIIHEIGHIKRHDNLWKLIGLIVATIHWFNPFVWIAYKLFSNDIEMACDEKVTCDKTKEEKKKYALSMLKCSYGQVDFLRVFPMFGAVSIKKRVKRLTENVKKNVLAIMVGVFLSIVILIYTLFDPVSGSENKKNFTYSTKPQIHITNWNEIAYIFDGELVIDESICSESNYRKPENIPNNNSYFIADDDMFITVIDKDGRVFSTCPYEYDQLAKTENELQKEIAEKGGNRGTGIPDAIILKEMQELDNAIGFKGSFAYDGYSYVDSKGKVFYNGSCIYSGNVKVLKIAGNTEDGMPYMLFEDGTLNKEYLNKSATFHLMYNDATEWTEIKDISGTGTIAALTDDGKIRCENKALQNKVSDWEKIIDFSYKYGNLVGVDENGRVLFASENAGLKMDIILAELAKWESVIAIDCNMNYVVGLTREGIMILPIIC